jgi:ribosomal protein S18 acetylase RimI-like enzyme
MTIKKIIENKEKFLDLLLLGDEQEEMIGKYLYRGELFALFDDDLKTVSVVTKEDENTYEIKNIATYEKYQGKGFGKIMVRYIVDNFKNKCRKILVGTGDSDRIIRFYKNCGFTYSHTEKNFFLNNYDHEMYDEGKKLKDMIYFQIIFDHLN